MSFPLDRLDHEWAAGRWYDLMVRAGLAVKESIAQIDDPAAGSHIRVLHGSIGQLLKFLMELYLIEPAPDFFDTKFLETMKRKREIPGEDLAASAPSYYALRAGFQDISEWIDEHRAEVMPDGVASLPALQEPRRSELLAKLEALTPHMGPG